MVPFPSGEGIAEREEPVKSPLMEARKSLARNGVFAHGAVPEVIADSWHRCLDLGLNATDKPVDAVLSYNLLRQARERNEALIAIVRPELELLSKQIAGTNFMTAFADCDGTVLEAIMDTEFSSSGCSRSIRPGSIWREDVRGTNALGLALFSGESSMVTGYEHFFLNQCGVSCISAPIFDSTGQIVGLLDTSSEIAARQFHTKALVDMAVINIENRLFVESHRGDHIIQFHPRQEYLATQSVGMISFSDDGAITGANRRAGDILSGIDLAVPRTFEDVFRGSFGQMLSTADSIRLVDWLNASYFARIRLTRPTRTIRSAAVPLAAKPVYAVSGSGKTHVFGDEHVRSSFRNAERALKIGLPFRVVGGPGTGRTTLLRRVHENVDPVRPLIAVDCRIAGTGGADGTLTAQTQYEAQVDTIHGDGGGTLVLEHLSAMAAPSARSLAHLVRQLLEPAAGARWLIAATDDTDGALPDDWCESARAILSRVTQMTIHLPPLSERTDFQQIAKAMMAGISPSHQLGHAALAQLEKLSRPRNLVDLETQLRILAVRCPVGVIRAEQVQRYLHTGGQQPDVCQRCAGHAVREAKCREINRAFRQCGSNVALTARKIGVSRNTVYSHIVK
ncbi:hypothetical protein GQA70_22610 (plasmid) [Ponticoccus alexandrii]|uniref:Sigma-54 factor interaction domain-containing protein n=2 Tax=Ponticoccus alexandrii TaxID=1943633 RepID=A0ABX7FF23_9RHOB|nr:hypothetical protein GQA70_22610 [Ponticoccus alexandrii]